MLYSEQFTDLFRDWVIPEKSTSPQWMARWKLLWEGGSKALEILAGGGVWT